jgi:hypothetical protein
VRCKDGPAIKTALPGRLERWGIEFLADARTNEEPTEPPE